MENARKLVRDAILGVVVCLVCYCPVLIYAYMNKPKTEPELIHIATWSQDDHEANAAMSELRERFDSTYIWCEDCDGVVVKKKDCCIEKPIDNQEVNYEIFE